MCKYVCENMYIQVGWLVSKGLSVIKYKAFTTCGYENVKSKSLRVCDKL